MRQNTWLEDFEETCQDILEDAILLDALALYLTADGTFTSGGQADYVPQVLRRLSGYLSQHALDLRNLEKRFGPDPQ